MMTNNHLITVSELVFRIKHLLEGEIGPVFVQGEVSNFSLSATGHIYFNLSDSESSISVALFKGDSFKNPLIKKVKNGDKILCYGLLSVYAKRGSFQVVAKKILPAGTGELLLKLHALKQKLEHEGLFSISHKKAIPRFPKRVALITSPHGAALHDFLEIFKRRAIGGEIILIPALVQGEEAPKSLTLALKKAHALKGIDVIVLARGGGSMEDLWAFNDEALAYEIYNSPLPIISAIGHEVDTSISDLVADLRAETPSAAAERLTAFQVEMTTHLEHSAKALLTWANVKTTALHLRLEKGHPKRLKECLAQKLLRYERRLGQIKLLESRYRYIPLQEKHFLLEENIQKLLVTYEKQLTGFEHSYETLFQKLKALDPKGVLLRGHTFITDQKNQVVGHKEQMLSILKKNESYFIHFHDGVVESKK